MTSPLASIIIPAHNEASVIERTLRELLHDGTAGRWEIIVVANGCSDDTGAIARRFEPHVHVVETQKASKSHALNLGDQAATVFPRLYLDADIQIAPADVDKLIRVLENAGDAPCLVVPRLQPVYGERSAWGVKAFYTIWQRTPAGRRGLIGTGIYGLNEAGRCRFGEFPELIADDGYVRRVFDQTERIVIKEVGSRVAVPQTLSALIKIKTRSRLGNYELSRREPALRNEVTWMDWIRTIGDLCVRPRLWPSVPMYIMVNLVTRVRAKRQLRQIGNYRWERDATSRAPVGVE